MGDKKCSVTYGFFGASEDDNYIVSMTIYGPGDMITTLAFGENFPEYTKMVADMKARYQQESGR